MVGFGEHLEVLRGWYSQRGKGDGFSDNPAPPHSSLRPSGRLLLNVILDNHSSTNQISIRILCAALLPSQKGEEGNL